MNDFDCGGLIWQLCVERVDGAVWFFFCLFKLVVVEVFVLWRFCFWTCASSARDKSTRSYQTSTTISAHLEPVPHYEITWSQQDPPVHDACTDALEEIVQSGEIRRHSQLSLSLTFKRNLGYVNAVIDWNRVSRTTAKPWSSPALRSCSTSWCVSPSDRLL